jgi:hypothetical protein
MMNYIVMMKMMKVLQIKSQVRRMMGSRHTRRPTSQ